MYSTCIYCNQGLGTNETLPVFPVGRRLAFDAARGRLWVVCVRCGRWNLTPLEERWEAIEACESLFRGTRLRMSTDNVGLARVAGGLELVRIGKALLPEVASWRYGGRLLLARGEREAQGIVQRSGRLLARTAAGALARYAARVGLSDDAMLRLRTFRRGTGVVVRAEDEHGEHVVVRYAHLGDVQLVRPERAHPWRLVVRHDEGVATLAERGALRAAGKLLATLNFGVATGPELQHAVAKLDHAGDPEGYFARVATIAIRTSWGRFPEAPHVPEPEDASRSASERLALQLANRSFWARGGTGSDERTPLYQLPAVDRLALEMAANEDMERAALLGELEGLHAAWREAEEIAAIADDLLSDELLEEFRAQLDARQRAAEG